MLDLVRVLQMADSGSGGAKKTVGQLLTTFKDTYGVQGFFTQVGWYYPQSQSNLVIDLI